MNSSSSGSKPNTIRKRRPLQKTAVRATCTSSVDVREDACLQYPQTNRFQGADSLDTIRNHLQYSQIGRSEKVYNIRIDQKPREPVMGIEPMTPVLPRLCATAAPHGQALGDRWAVRDSNPRSRRQLIYSQPHLATLVTAQNEKRPSDKSKHIRFARTIYPKPG